MAILANARASQIVLGRPSPDLEEALSALDEIVEDGNRAGQVLQRLRGLLKKEESRRELVDLNEIVRSTHLLVRNELIIRKINATLDSAPNLAPVLGDPVQLQQVAMNLLVNAMDAVASRDIGGREIVVSTRPGDAGRLAFTVLDNGPGIPADAEKRLFQPFFTTKSNGLGLGLAICHSILGTHGGSLRLSSAEKGGAIATVILPAAEMLAAAQ